MLFGYRFGEVPLPALTPVKSDLKVGPIRTQAPVFRPPVQVSLGCHVQGVAQWHPDPSDPETLLAGVYKRFGREPPPVRGEIMASLLAYVPTWLRKNGYQPLPADTDFSFQTWLANRPYAEWRKQELKAEWERTDGCRTRRDEEVKTHMKWETYPAAKHARCINARADAFKVFYGPIVAAVEKEIFSNTDLFIKKVPVRDRPKHLRDLLSRGHGPIKVVDFESYESLFTAAQMKIEAAVGEYFLLNCPQALGDWRQAQKVKQGSNKLSNKFFTVRLRATRNSGEMDTSMANGVHNSIVVDFLRWYYELGSENEPRNCEGDDSIGTEGTGFPTEDMFLSVGIRAKIETYDRLEEASFCGCVFDPDDGRIVTDPRDVLSTFGFASGRYAMCRKTRLMELLRAKSLSILHQYPGCPILVSLGLYGLRMTRGIDLRRYLSKDKSISMWEREQLQEAMLMKWKDLGVAPGSKTRLLVEQLYGISVESQIRIEKYLDDLNSIQPLRIELDFDPSWQEYYNSYSATYIPGESPIFPCTQVKDWPPGREPVYA